MKTIIKSSVIFLYFFLSIVNAYWAPSPQVIEIDFNKGNPVTFPITISNFSKKNSIKVSIAYASSIQARDGTVKIIETSLNNIKGFKLLSPNKITIEPDKKNRFIVKVTKLGLPLYLPLLVYDEGTINHSDSIAKVKNTIRYIVTIYSKDYKQSILSARKAQRIFNSNLTLEKSVLSEGIDKNLYLKTSIKNLGLPKNIEVKVTIYKSKKDRKPIGILYSKPKSAPKYRFKIWSNATVDSKGGINFPLKNAGNYSVKTSILWQKIPIKSRSDTISFTKKQISLLNKKYGINTIDPDLFSKPLLQFSPDKRGYVKDTFIIKNPLQITANFKIRCKNKKCGYKIRPNKFKIKSNGRRKIKVLLTPKKYVISPLYLYIKSDLGKKRILINTELKNNIKKK